MQLSSWKSFFKRHVMIIINNETDGHSTVNMSEKKKMQKQRLKKVMFHK